jgi:hypothetical protein
LKIPALENIEIIKIDEYRKKISKQSKENLKISVKPDNLAIYHLYLRLYRQTKGSDDRAL